MSYRSSKVSCCIFVACAVAQLAHAPEILAAKKKGMWGKPNPPAAARSLGGNKALDPRLRKGRAISPKDYVRFDRWAQAFKKLPGYARLGKKHVGILTELGKRYACLPWPSSVRGESLGQMVGEMVLAYQAEIAFLEAYTQQLNRALDEAPRLRRPPAGLASLMGASATDRLTQIGCAGVVSEALEQGKKNPVFARDGLLVAVMKRVEDARYQYENLRQFAEVIREADEHVSKLRGNVRRWNKQAERLGAASPLDPEAVRALAVEGQELIKQGEEVINRLPNGVVSRAGSDPLAGVVEEGEDHHYTETAPDPEAEAIRSTMDRACQTLRADTQGDVEAVEQWIRVLRERAGLSTSHFIAGGAPVPQGVDGASAVSLLKTRYGEFRPAEGQGNRGRYQDQEAVILAQRLVWDLLHQIKKADERSGRDDLGVITRRAMELRQEARVFTLSDELTVADIIRDPAKVCLALGLGSATPLHLPNKVPRYRVKKDRYNSLHELLAWRGVELLEMLARGTPAGAKGLAQEDLGWTFSLSDAGQGEAEAFWTKIPRAWDTKGLLMPQVRVGRSGQFWSRFWGDPPVQNEGRVVARAAEVAAVQLLVEQRFVDRLSPEERRTVGAKKRKWVDPQGLELTDILGTSAVSTEELAVASSAPEGRGGELAATQLREDGRRFSKKLGLLFSDLQNRPMPWFEPFAPLVSEEGLEVGFDARLGRIVLRRTEADGPDATGL